MESHSKQCQPNLTLTLAGNGLKAISKLTGGLRPDLILADSQMPIMNGYEFLVWLMESPAYQHIPIVIWAGDMPDHAVTRYYQAGANSVMLKPNALQRVEAFCQHWFELVQLPHSLATAQQ